MAYAALNDAEPGRVLVVTPGDTALEAALATKEAGRIWRTSSLRRPSMLTTDEYKRDAEPARYDLVIYDQCAAGRDAPGQHAVDGPVAAGAGVAGSGRRPPPRTATPRMAIRRRTRPRRTMMIRANRSPRCRRLSTGTGPIRCWPMWSWATSDIPDSLVLRPPPGAAC